MFKKLAIATIIAAVTATVLTAQVQVVPPDPLQHDTLVFLAGATSGFSPADATTYQFGMQVGVSPTTTSAAVFSPLMTRSGHIRRVYGVWIVAGTLGSAGSSTVRVKNLTTTSTENVSTAVGATATLNTFSNTAMTLSFSAGDALALELISPTWVTNPTATFFNVSIEVEYD
jgi:hypothetical protein